MRDPKPLRGVVYTTGVGRVCPECAHPIATCDCANAPARASSGGEERERVVRIRRDRRDRRGKTVTLVEDVPLAPAELAQLASELKRMCGTGGGVDGATIELQGDLVDRLEPELLRRGFRVKRVGG